MPYDGSGNFSLVPGTLVAAGQTIQPSQHNPNAQDVASGLSQTVLRTGVAPMTGALNMNGNRITGAAPGVDNNDVVIVSQTETVDIGDGKWSANTQDATWLRRNGATYDTEDYPDLANALRAFDPNTPLGTYSEAQGGYYIGYITYADERVFALFTPEKSEGQDNSVQWKTSVSETSDTQDEDDGWANLQGMTDASPSAHPMGQFCAGVTAGGKSDWYPPARNELSVMYAARNSIVGDDAIDTDTTVYWSSTQRVGFNNNAWVRNFSSGFSGGESITNSNRVRVIRRVDITVGEQFSVPDDDATYGWVKALHIIEPEE